MRNLLLLVCFTFLTIGITTGQSLDELKSMQADKIATAGDLQGQIDALHGEIDDLQGQIDKLSGWRTALNGVVNFGLGNNSNWIGSPNPNASSTSLGIGIFGHALKDTEKSLWHNRLTIDKQWNDIDLVEGVDNGGLFDNAVSDVLNISSLYGYKIHPKLAISGLADLKTSVENFLKPGDLDIGVGVTWLPIENMTVVIHPINYHVAWPADGTALETKGALGAKFQVNYFKDLTIAGRNISWVTELTGFLPYSDKKQDVLDETGALIRQAGLTTWEWNNNFTWEIWKGIGVNLGLGFRNSQLQFDGIQRYTKLGFSYSL